jgi:hypothetical protein
MRFLLLILAGLLALAGAASAQIATPSMNPNPLFTSTPTNPATLSWDMPSRIGAGYSQVKLDDGTQVNSGSAKQALAQHVGPRFGVGVAWANLSSPTVGGTLDQTITIINGSMQFGGWLSLGLGHEKLSRDIGVQTYEETVPVYGASVRLADVIYLGAVGGKSDANNNGATGKRDVSRYGVAYYWHDKSGGLRVELARQRVDNVVTGPVDGDANNIVALEAKMGRLMVGFLRHDDDVIDGATGTVISNQKRNIYSLAWVPEQGLSYALSYMHFTGTGGGPVDTKITALSVSWLY